MKKKNWVLILSVALNILLVFVSVLLLPQKGESFYLFGNTPPSPMPNPPNTPVTFSNYYIDRKSLFDFLPATNNDIIFLGDSLTNRCEWSELFEKTNIKNRGINGDNTYGVLKRLDQITISRPKKIFIMIGINDIVAKENLDKIVYKYKVILNNIKQSTPITKVIVQSVLPVNNRIKWIAENNDVMTLNTRLKALTEEFKYEYVDLYSVFASTDNQLTELYTNDGIHLNGIGYLIWKQSIRKYVD